MSERVVLLPRCTSSTLGAIQAVTNPPVTLDTIRNIRAPSIRLAVRIVHNENQINAIALLDSGAEGIYCNSKFVTRYKLPIQALDTPIYPRNVDGSTNQYGAIRHAAILRMEMGQRHRETTELLVTNIGEHDILLGTDWLKAHNPNIDWSTNQMTLNRCPPRCFGITRNTPKIYTLLPIFEWESQDDDHLEIKRDDLDTSQRVRVHLDKFDEPAQVRPWECPYLN